MRSAVHDDKPKTRFLSREECTALVNRVAGFGTGGGVTTLFIDSSWTGNLRWARNQITTSGDVRNHAVVVGRNIRGAEGWAGTNRLDDTMFRTAVRRAERFVQLKGENPYDALMAGFTERYPEPAIWSEATYRQDVASRAELMRQLVEPSIKAGMQSAGYIQMSAQGRASMKGGQLWYYPYTLSQYSVTVRDPQGQGSGWAGADHTDWSKIDAEKLSAIALDKCLRSRNPVRLEPGRYTAILEPQAVCDLISPIFTWQSLDRELAEYGDDATIASSDPYRRYAAGDKKKPAAPFGKGGGMSRLGERVIDERITFTSDPMDPETGYPPFFEWTVSRPVTWVENGVLKELAYSRDYAVKRLGLNTSGYMPTGAVHMTARGPQTTVDEMIATTKRGVLVTRFWEVSVVDRISLLLTGYTRDGLWLIEDGKISKPIKNFRFTESPLFALNSLEQIGVPQRTFHPQGGAYYPAGYAPVVVPALKVRDFSFTSLSDAI